MSELFRNAHDALTFAYNYSSQQYALSPMAKMMKTGIGSDKGLVSQDGAAQAGIIKAHVGRLNILQIACITARFAPRYEECPCCANKDKMTEAYREAIAVLAEWSISQITGITIRNMRAAIVRSYFERGVSILSAANDCNVPKRTAYDQKAKIFKALKVLDGQALKAIESQLDIICEPAPETACV